MAQLDLRGLLTDMIDIELERTVNPVGERLELVLYD